jgi:hypothetical protein
MDDVCARLVSRKRLQRLPTRPLRCGYEDHRQSFAHEKFGLLDVAQICSLRLNFGNRIDLNQGGRLVCRYGMIDLNQIIIMAGLSFFNP